MRLFLTLFACLLASQLYAQDTLYFRKQATTLVVQVTEITPSTVKYRRIDQTDSSVVELRKGYLNKIVFANGTTTWMNADAWERQNKYNRTGRGRPDLPPAVPAGIRLKPTGNHIISLMPLTIQSNGWGATASYEQLIGKKHHLGIRVPLTFTFGDPRLLTSTRSYSGLYIQPGLRYYPFGQRVFTAFVTPGLYAGYGNRLLRRKSVDLYGNERAYSQLMSDFQYGAHLDVGFHMQRGKHVSFTMSGGPGLAVSDFFKLHKHESKLFGKLEIGLAYRFFTKK